jgi:orotate phosphoribosyltransferase
MNLFRSGEEFKLHSGERSDWKIDCDALTGADWRTLANVIAKRVGPFRNVCGIAWGGLPLREALLPFETKNDNDPWLLVDDVYSTGGSMRHLRSGFPDTAKVIGVVVFARRPVQENWIKALFTMTLEDQP